MADLYDIALTSAGALPSPLALVSGDALTVQRVKRRLLTHEGEVTGHRQDGLPFLTWLATKPVPALIAARVEAELAGVPGLAAVSPVTATQTGREINLECTLTLTSGKKARLRFVPAPGQGGTSNPAMQLLLAGEGFW